MIRLQSGSYGLAEIKLGCDRLIGEAIKTLKALACKIDTQRMKAPSFLMVLTGVGSRAYRTGDGIYVVPVTALKD